MDRVELTLALPRGYRELLLQLLRYERVEHLQSEGYSHTDRRMQHLPAQLLHNWDN